MQTLTTDGRFFRLGPERSLVRVVTYGPFPESFAGRPHDDLLRIRDAGFHAIRLYDFPDRDLLDAAENAGILVIAGLRWPQNTDFLRHPAPLAAARVALTRGLLGAEGSPALAAILVGNEIPADLVRWMKPWKVRRSLEDLIHEGRSLRPDLLWGYANYPSTEYLEPENADFTAFNLYLEQPQPFRSYLRRLHHLAGDRPVLISEFGLDSRRHSPATQASTLAWAIHTAIEEGIAGFTVYAWSDRWLNAGHVVEDWDFGLLDRRNQPKPALDAVRRAWDHTPSPPAETRIAVIVCTRNGRQRIAPALEGLRRQSLPPFETIVVDDGSTDGTSEFVRQHFPETRVLTLPPSGLSTARNAGARLASAPLLAFTDDDCEPDPDWLKNLARTFSQGWTAVGGPNLPPPARHLEEAVVTAAPGAPSHVMLDDLEAEHLPGCNLAVRREAYWNIGGFDPEFHTAGDDVDFCWRLRDAGGRLGFSPNAFVWHDRRPTIGGYLRQQRGYGIAEAILRRKHPSRFNPSGDARWQGSVYVGAPVRVMEHSIIYHGPMGLAGYQGIVDRMQPIRPIEPAWNRFPAPLLLKALQWLQPRIRAWFRCRKWRLAPLAPHPFTPPAPTHESALWSPRGSSRQELLQTLLDAGASPQGPHEPWDLEWNGTLILIATELGEGPERLHRLRTQGPHQPVIDLLTQAGLGTPVPAT